MDTEVFVVRTGNRSVTDVTDVVSRFCADRGDRYRHRHGSRGHGADHLLAVLVSPSPILAVEVGDVLLGTWQRVALVDLNADDPDRRLRRSWIGSPAA